MLVACNDKAVETTDRWTDESLSSNMPVPLSWYTEEQLDAGERLCLANCAECHGRSADGAPNWQAVEPDGRRRPPPLNGTDDAWHQSVGDFRGGYNFGDQGTEDGMPSRQDKLTDEDVLAVIAWLRSLWSDEVYAKWHCQHHRDQWH